MGAFKKSQNLKINISFVDADDVALNITGATVRFMMKNNQNDPDTAALVTKSTSSGISITNGAGGLAEVTLTASDLDDVKKGVYCEAMAINGSEIIRTATYFFEVRTNIIKALS